MKLNLDYYKEDIKYNNYEKEDEIIKKYIMQNKNINDIKNLELEEMLALSPIRTNILSWYQFEKNISILEIGAGLGEITGLLCEKAKNVVSIEFSKARGEAIKQRYENKENLEVIIGKIEDIQIEEKFDYITLIGTLEYIEKIYSKPINNFLEDIKKHLKPNGKILIAMNNKIGLNYWCKTDKTGENVTNILNKHIYSIEKFTNILDSVQLKERKIYYPMPDYKLTNVIFTNQKLLSKNNLDRNIIYHGETDIEFYNQNQAYREILKEDGSLFKIFANSFLLEIFNGEKKENNISLVSFSNMRKRNFMIKTIIGKENVYKYPQNESAKNHINKIKENIETMNKLKIKTIDTYEEERIISKFCTSPTVDEVIVELIKNNKKEEAINIMKNFKKEIYEKLVQKEINTKENVFDKYNIKYKKEDIENMQFVQDGLWDLIFSNCFYIKDEFYFYDQEWKEENIPINFIIYRAIKYFNRIKKYITNEELYKILEIPKENIELFNKLDDKIQEELRNEKIWKINTQGTNILGLKRAELTKQNEINLLNIEISKKDGIINDKNNEIISIRQDIEKLNSELNYMKNSKSWKITKPLRKIYGKN